MNPVISGIITSVAVVVALVCAFRLSRMGSSLAATLLKISPYAAVLFAVIAFFVGMMDDMEEYIGLKYFFIIAAVTILATVLIARAFSISRRFLLRPEEEKKKTRKRRSRISVPTQTTLCILDAISLAMAGFTLGANFSMNVGTGFFVAIALFFFVFNQRIVSIDRIEQRINAKAGYINLFVSFSMFLVAAIVTILALDGHLTAACVCISIAAGYLLYLALWHFYNIVRTAKK